MAAPSLWVKKEIQLAAALQIKGKNFREAVETLLTNDLSFEDDGMNTPGKTDAGPLLQTALGFLTQQPHAALGVEIGAGTKEIRSNYKKLAVKYHPDKNPKTTVLFQAINTACARLSDRELRKVAERSAPSSSSSSSTVPNPPNSTHRPPPYAAHPSTSESTPAEVARKAAEERRKREAEAARAKVNFARRAEEAMQQKKKEEEDAKKRQEEELRKRKDDIIREGQRAYHEEQLRAQRESQIRQERRAAEISAAATRAKQNASVPPIDIPGLKSFREGTKSTQAKGASETGLKNKQPQESVPLSARGKDSSPSSSVRGNTPRAMEPDVMPKSPVGLRCVSYTDTAVDLQWLPIIGLVELNWRNKALSKDAWRNANKLISGTKCRKKNLLAGATYEFRVRTVVEKAGGMLGLRSPWSTLIEVALKPSPGKEETGSSSANSYSGSEKIKKEVFIRPPVRAASVSQMPISTPRSEASEPSTPRAETPRAEPELKAEKTTSVPVNLRPGPILTGLKESIGEVEDEVGIKMSPPSTRHHAWGQERPPSPASEVDSSDSELDERDQSNKKEVTLYEFNVPEGSKNQELIVRKEPIASSKICGYLDAGIVVEAEADCGGWLKVKCHRKAALKNKVDGKQLVEKEKEVWGWCLRSSPDGLELLKRCRTSASERSREEEQDDDESGSEPDKIDEYGLGGGEGYSGVWYEMEGDDGRPYFYNDQTGESSWYPPEWVEETDPHSGASYYLHLSTDESELHSTWTRPDAFAKLVRLSGQQTSIS